MRQNTRNDVRVSIGLDLGDRKSLAVGVTRGGEIVVEERVLTTRDALKTLFSKIEGPARVILEAGTHSPWVSALLEELELDVVVANPSNAGRALAANGRKTDRLDAITLATLGFDSVRLLRPIKHRGRKAQCDLAIVKARHCAVRMRTQSINAVRCLVKSSGERLPSCSSESFAHKAREGIPDDLRPALLPLLDHIAELTKLIHSYDKQVKALAEKYPETERLQEIGGVGPLISTAFVLTIDDPKRFKKSRNVGAYVGLVPREHASGDQAPQLRISKAGNKYLRELLLSAAHYILGPFGDDCDLRRFGERVGARGGPKGKKRAATAVARKLAVVMHRIWISGEHYEPFRSSKPKRKPKQMSA
jgi:transposase